MQRTARLARLLPLVLILFAWPVATFQVAEAGTSNYRVAPNFSRVDLNHHKIELTSYRGKVVLLNFWATWCGPCLAEMPIFSEWQKQYGADKFQVIGVSMDDAVPEVIATVSKFKPDYPVVMGDEHLGTAYGGIMGVPVTFLIDREGRIRGRYSSTDLPRMKEEIQELLAGARTELR
jgi:thiol-disulfide isomerase/thioredoxin